MTADETAGQPAHQIVEQRIRNRLIEYFEWVSSFEEQRRYQAAVPGVSVVKEVFEQWYAWNPQPMAADDFGPVYSSDEGEAMLSYDSVLERAFHATPDSWQPMEVFHALPIWEELRESAAEALAVFARRGPLPEDHEV